MEKNGNTYMVKLLSFGCAGTLKTQNHHIKKKHLSKTNCKLIESLCSDFPLYWIKVLIVRQEDHCAYALYTLYLAQKLKFFFFTQICKANGDSL